jgi:hypothetical protein
MKQLNLFLTLSCFALFSCGHSSKVDNNTEKTVVLPYHVDLEINLNKAKLIPLSSIGKEMEYIPLETTQSSLISKINQIFFSDSYIFISDFHKLFQFDRNGKFIRQVGANGRGPGEYINVSGFCIDKKKEKVYIIAWGIHTILEFDFNGKFIRSFDHAFSSVQFLVNDTNRFVFRLNDLANVTNSSDFKLYITDIKGTPLVKIKNYSRRTSKPAFLFSITPMYYFNDNIQFMQFGVDTLYTLKKEKLEPYAIFNLGKMKMDPNPTIPLQNMEEGMDRLKHKLWIDKISENVQYLFLGLNYGFSDSSTTCIVNKLTLETSFLENNSFRNDIDGAIKFWPKYVYNDSILVDYIDAFKLLSIINKNHFTDSLENERKLPDQFEKLRKKLTETSNPILIVCK